MTERAKIHMRPYRPGDEDAFHPRADFGEEREANGWDWSKGPPGATWTIMRGAEVIGIGGGVDLGDGRWQVWAQLAPVARRDWPALIHHAGIVLTHLELCRGATSIVAQAREGQPGAVRCLQELRFEEAGPATDGYLRLERRRA